MNLLKKAYCRAYQFCYSKTSIKKVNREPMVIDSLANLATEMDKRGAKSVLVVTDKNLVNLGMVQPLLNELDNKKISHTLFDETVSNPTVANVEAARIRYISNSCDSIIGFGGGSAIDCAKATAAKVSKPGIKVENMRGAMKVSWKTPLLIAVPTTAGSGTEVLMTAVLTDADKHYKFPINGTSLIPNIAVQDVSLLKGLPKSNVVSTGMVALSNAIEAYIGTTATDNARELAEEAIFLIRDNLKAAYDDDNNMAARSKLLKASYCAGVACNYSNVGYANAMAHSISGYYGIYHGYASAVLLPYILEEYGADCEKMLGKLSRRCDFAHVGTDDHTSSERFIKWIKEISRSMDIPEKLDVIRDEDVIVMSIFADRESNPLYPVPKLMDVDELAQVFLKAKA